ncbi:MAG: hypothetical protein KTR27_04635, partial [Leptolyngbyaceae cyanobacterium MAG.088]|nr:hypothetical protein [Leptolyngbyaceae cyanobacterium MAG.088]
VLFGGHGAILKRTIFTPVSLVGALFLVPMARAQAFSSLKAVRPAIHVFTKLTCVSLLWFTIAYTQAFKLHMPGRYTSHCIMIAIPILAAITWTTLLDTIWSRRLPKTRPIATYSLRTIAVLAIVIPLFFYYPLLLKKFPKTLYMTGKAAPIYEYLQTQPPDSLVASLDYEADNIPVFAKRPTLIAPEYATPFHLGYYRQIRQRATDLLHAHYTSDKDTLTTFINHYGVDFWLVNKAAFNPNYLNHHRYWQNNYALTPLNQKNLKQSSVLSNHIRQCAVVETKRFWLAPSPCIVSESMTTDTP